jgi:putative transposase
MYGIDPPAVLPQQFPPVAQVTALGVFLSDEEIEMICRQLGHVWRCRLLPPGVTVRSMVYRSLHPDHSIQAVVADLAAGGDRPDAAPSAAAWCQARSRLPADLWPKLLQRSVDRLGRLAGRRHLVFGRPLYVVDGSTVSMPDEPPLVKAFGYANTRHGPSRFPVARFALILLAGVEAICAWRLDPYRAAEDEQFHRMWNALPDGCIVLFDRHFGSFYNLAKLRQRQTDVLTRLHQRRNPGRLIARGRRLGNDEWLVTIDLARQLRKRYHDPTLPPVLHVRLIRVTFRRGKKRRRLWLVTTLLDPKRYPCRALIDLYRRRWGIETRYASLKTTLKLNVLRSLSLRGARYEVAATVLAHNLVWTLIHQAAHATETPPDRISFADAIKAALAFSTALRQAPPARRERLYDAMLRQIARRTNLHRPGRVEPRLIKREPVRFGYLRISRDEARRKCLS